MDLSDRESMFRSLPPGGIGTEIGVADGGFSEIIIREAKPRLFFCIDCWALQSEGKYGHDPANTQHDEKYYATLRRFLFEPHVKVVKAFSLEAASLFPDGYFDFLYLDGNHLECYADMTAWWPKVKPNGWLMGHDYVSGGVGDYITVQADVDRWAREYGVSLLLTDDEVWKNWLIQKQ